MPKLHGLGNYSSTRSYVERRPALLVKLQGPRAHIRFHDGMSYAMPSQPLLAIGIVEGGTFFVVTTWVGKDPIESHVEPPAVARPPMPKKTTPKIMVRSGRKMVTRKGK